MAQELEAIDISSSPELLRLAEEVHRTGQPRSLRRNGEDVAVLMPAPPRKKGSTRARPVTREDPLFALIGIGKSGIKGGVSEKKHEYLARAYRPR